MRYSPAKQFFILDVLSPVHYFSSWQEFLMCKHSFKGLDHISCSMYHFWKHSSSPLWSGGHVFLEQTSLFRLCPVEFQVVCTEVLPAGQFSPHSRFWPHLTPSIIIAWLELRREIEVKPPVILRNSFPEFFNPTWKASISVWKISRLTR